MYVLTIRNILHNRLVLNKHHALVLHKYTLSWFTLCLLYITCQHGLIEAMSNLFKPSNIIVFFYDMLPYDMFHSDKDKRACYIPAKIELWPRGVVQG